MGGPLPSEIEPLKCAEVRTRLRGCVALSELAPLLPHGEAQDGTAEFDLRFDVDEAGVRFVEGEIRVRLQTVCQRCMEPMVVEFTATPCLGIVASEGEARRLPPGYEPLIVSGPIRLYRLLEDELILNMPMTPKHPLGTCRPFGVASEGRAAASPFAQLAALLKTEGPGA